jgi:hypothetical protein
VAGDWIKVEHATLDKPEVLRTAEMLGISRRETIGLFFEFWIWLDKNLSGSCPDFVRNVSRKSLDDVLHCPGFAACLEAVGWAQFDDRQWIMRVSNAARHNGNTAKNRALDTKRKAESRAETVRDLSGFNPDKTTTREEKRRVTTPPTPAAGFDEFWTAYPKKVGKPDAAKSWKRINPSPETRAAILAGIEVQKRSPQWTKDGGEFIPHPATWLNREGWNDQLAASLPQMRKVAL